MALWLGLRKEFALLTVRWGWTLFCFTRSIAYTQRKKGIVTRYLISRFRFSCSTDKGGVLQCNNEIHDWHRVPFLSGSRFRFSGFSYSCHHDFMLVSCKAKFESATLEWRNGPYANLRASLWDKDKRQQRSSVLEAPFLSCKYICIVFLENTTVS